MAALSHLVARSADDGTGLYYTGDKQLFALNTVFLVFAVAVVVLRYWVTRERAPWYSVEDALCLASLISYIPQCALVYVMVLQAHVGNPDRSSSENDIYFRMRTAAQFPYGFEMGFIRASVLVFELRLFGVNKWFRYAGRVTLALVASWTLMTCIVALTICDPIKKQWDPSAPGHCGNLKATYEGISGSGIVLDVMIFSLPMPIIWKLHTSVSHKILISLLFVIGAFDIVCGAMRLDALVHEVSPVFSLTWGIIEPSVAIFVASAPHYRGLYNGLAIYMDQAGSSVNTIFKTLRRFSGGSKNKVVAKELDSVSESSTMAEVPHDTMDSTVYRPA